MRKGFTLAEIMIIVAIIALLVALVVPTLLRARTNANDASARTVLRTIANACESYAAANNGNYPTSIGDLINAYPKYLNQNYTASTQSGYNIVCPTLNTIGYSCSASPAVCNTTGTKNCTIQTGAVLVCTGC